MIGVIRLSQIAEAFSWEMFGNDVVFNSVATDSRHIAENALFVALVGDNFDGHDFIDQAIAGGAVAVLVQREVETSVPVLKVSDTLQALACIASVNRQKFEYPLIALTGSAGKTSTKAMIAHVLGSQQSTFATRGNYNNEIGVPLSLLGINVAHRYAVIEMGASKVGDIEYLAEYALPDVALVTNAAEVHIEGFGSLDGVVQGKGEIFKSLNNGTAIINADSVHRRLWQLMVGATNRVLTFGLNERADIRALAIRVSSCSSQFKLQYGEDVCEVHLPVSGQHNVMNALAATACCLAVGINLSLIGEALSDFNGVGSRLERHVGIAGATVIDDSYNANPLAFKAAIDVLSKAGTNTVLVMGDMGELGEIAEESHRAVGVYAQKNHIQKLYGVGALSRYAVQAFGSVGGYWFATKPELINYLKSSMQGDETVLIKGSRSAHMEEVVHALVESNQPDNNSKRGVQC